MNIVETKQDIEILMGKLVSRSFIMDIVPLDDERHPANTGISLIFFKFIGMGGKWCLPVNHNEAVCLPGSLELLKETFKLSIERGSIFTLRKMVLNKKMTIQLLGQDYGFVDVNVVEYLKNGSPIEFEEFATNAHIFIKTRFRNIKNANRCIPLYKHAHVFENNTDALVVPTERELQEPGFEFMNHTMTDNFAWLEATGLAVDTELFTKVNGDEQLKHIKNGLIYSQYNLYTATGRPSNRHGGVNYAALNKKDGSRDAFVSRHGEDGMLVMMDYTAFHPHLIARLVNFEFPHNDNPYAYLAKFYFEKTEVDEEDIAVSKGLTFQQLYGGVDKRWVHIPYFAKIQEYIDHRWRFFEENGYIETPKYLRKIKPCHIQDATPNKLFNYILQAFETEVAVGVLGELQLHLKNRKSKPILYTYDSILFDFHKDDKMETIVQVKKIMEGSGFPVKVYVGKSYSDLQKIDVG